MTNEEIQQLIRLAQDSRVAELEVQRGENRVRIRLAGATTDVVPAAIAVPGPVPVASAPAAHAPEPAAPADPLADPSLVMIKSPIVGTFYDAPSPDAAPFIKVGDTVTVGKVLCIIESMKLMNEIESEYAGTIVAKLVSNTKPVEYGEALFALKPNK
ncbi:MAG: acetyl-CoA carboxylase biotin carboxyl carrier protein [Bryobacteraceae bacterium]|nr:acetyl-CoA carboxylase biotin carboxyl carrier protein [Bryobacteraceae bacterium]